MVRPENGSQILLRGSRGGEEVFSFPRKLRATVLLLSRGMQKISRAATIKLGVTNPLGAVSQRSGSQFEKKLRATALESFHFFDNSFFLIYNRGSSDSCCHLMQLMGKNMVIQLCFIHRCISRRSFIIWDREQAKSLFFTYLLIPHLKWSDTAVTIKATEVEQRW